MMYRQNRIVGISGSQGCGKTTVLTALGYMAYRNGKKIYSTYHVNYSGGDSRDYIPVTSMDDIRYMKGGPKGAVWLADELYQWLFSRSSQSEINKQISMILMVARKRGISIYYTSHHPMHIDVMLRRITNNWVIPRMRPVYNINIDKVKEKAAAKNMDPMVLYRQARNELRQHPELWVIKCDVFNDLEQYTNTFRVKNLPYIFKMFDTTEEVAPLDLEGKPETIREKGLEYELLLENILNPYGYVWRNPHTGKNMDTHSDLLFFPSENTSIMYLIDASGNYQKNIHKTGHECKQLLEESHIKKPIEYNMEGMHPEIQERLTQVTEIIPLIMFSYMDKNWVLPIHSDDYYLDYTSKLFFSERLKELVSPLDKWLYELK